MKDQVIRIGDYNITVRNNEITISGGVDTYIGWTGTLEAAIETVEGWV